MLGHTPRLECDQASLMGERKIRYVYQTADTPFVISALDSPMSQMNHLTHHDSNYPQEFPQSFQIPRATIRLSTNMQGIATLQMQSSRVILLFSRCQSTRLDKLISRNVANSECHGNVHQKHISPFRTPRELGECNVLSCIQPWNAKQRV